MGGTGAAGRRARRADRGPGRHACAAAPRSREILVEHGRATGVRLASGETIAADIVVSNADSAWTYRYLLPPEQRRRWTDRKHRARALLDGPVRLVLRHEAPLRGRRASHDPARPALSRPARRHLRAQGAGRGLQPLPAPADRDRSRRWRPPGCDAFYVLSPVPNLQAAPTGRKRAEPYRSAIPRHLLERRCCPDLGTRSCTSRVHDAAGFPGPALVVPRRGVRAGAGADPERLVPPAQPQRGRRSLYLVGAGTHPGAGLPGVLSSARVLDTVVPMLPAPSSPA